MRATRWLTDGGGKRNSQGKSLNVEQTCQIGRSEPIDEARLGSRGMRSHWVMSVMFPSGRNLKRCNGGSITSSDATWVLR